jgi:hypothetical protein
MTTPKQYIGRKAVKATVRHSVRGTAAKARREPPRTITLVGIGVFLGALGVWALGRRSGAASDPFPAYRAPAPAATQSTPEAKAAAAA